MADENRRSPSLRMKASMGFQVCKTNRCDHGDHEVLPVVLDLGDGALVTVHHEGPHLHSASQLQFVTVSHS